MRIRTAIAVPVASAAAAALLVAAPPGRAATGDHWAGRCAERSLTLRASAVAGEPAVLLPPASDGHRSLQVIGKRCTRA
ncbi:hypothetical protein ACWEN3_45385 [Streptomyces sp. NPDC004561]